MSVVGLDLGTANFVVAQVKRGGVDVILNESSKRVNPTLVSFNGQERFMGDAATTQVRMNYKNTVTQLNRVVGRKIGEPCVKQDIDDHLHYKLASGSNDDVVVEVNYNDGSKQFTTQQLTAMVLQKVKEIVANSAAEDAKASGAAHDAATARAAGVAAARNMDLVVSVPVYYTNKMRAAVMDACRIAGVNCLRLINEPTGVALGYGIFRSAKKEFSDDKDTKVMLLDAGHANFTASVVSFRNGELRMLSSICDNQCGSRDIDIALAKHFAKEFKEKTGLDAWGNRKARIKLLIQAEKVKKTLSPYGVNQAPISVECIMEDTDYSSVMKIDTLEELAAPVASRIPSVIERALATANVKPEDLASVEVVGGGSRPRIVKRRMAEALNMPLNEATGHNLSTTLNQDEAVARGAALQCAMLSPMFRVKPFDIVDVVPYPIRVSWEPSSDQQEDAENCQHVIFNAGDVTPVTRRLTFRRWGAFDIVAEYIEDAESKQKQAQHFPEGQPRQIAKYHVEGVAKPGEASADSQPPKVRVDFCHDLHGCLRIVKAEYLQEIEAPKESEGDKQDEASKQGKEDANKKDSEQQDTNMEGGASETPKGEETPKAQESGKKEEPPKKKRFKRVELSVRCTPLAGEGWMTAEELDSATKAEHAMLARDLEIRATQDMRNDLESYIYAMRSAVEDGLSSFVKADEAENFKNKLNEMEDWLYEDGFDASKTEYETQLQSLKKIGGPIEQRKLEEERRGPAGKALLDAIEAYKAVLASTDEQYAHLTDSNRDTLRAATHEAEAWFRDQQDEQSKLARHQDPVLTVAAIQQRLDALHKECAPIKNKPKPKPPAPKEQPKKDEDVDMDKAEKEAPAEDNKPSEQQAEGEDVNMEGDAEQQK